MIETLQMPRHRFLLVTLAGAFLTGAFAQTPDDQPLEEVVVTGEFPGPGMWKMTRADDPFRA